MRRATEQINVTLPKYQAQINDWRYRAADDDHHVWPHRFIVESKLHTTTPAITIERPRRGCSGHYCPGRNGVGLRHKMAFRQEHVEGDAYGEVIGTLLHELLHAEQEEIGTPGRRNAHNKPCRDRAYEFGLIVDARGRQQYAPASSPFLDLPDKYGVQGPELSPPDMGASSSSTEGKLRPWAWGGRPRSIRLRVAIRDLGARCLRCGQMFRPKGGLGITRRGLRRTTSTIHSLATTSGTPDAIVHPTRLTQEINS